MIVIDGKSYYVVENLGFVHDIGAYVRMVRDGDRERAVVKEPGGSWRFTKPQVGPGSKIMGM